MGLAAAPAGDLEPVADLDALHRLDAHHRLGQQRVELAVPVDVAAEADRHAVAEHLDDAAERVAVLGGGLDLVDHRLLGGRVEAAHRRLVDGGEIGRRRRRGTAVGPCTAPIWITCERTSMPSVPSSFLASAPAATRAAVSRALARSSTSRASVKPYFCMPGEVGMPGRGPA